MIFLPVPEEVEVDKSQGPTSDNKDIILLIQVCVESQSFHSLFFN